MKADYHRYITEYATGDQHQLNAQAALEAYEEATKIAVDKLKTTNPIRLGLALNYSVFQYEVENNPAKACKIAKSAFDEAMADIDHIQEDQYKDSTTIMQLIRENLTLWTSEMQEDEGDEERM
jgi:14-3-3 protein epsilon